MLLQSALTAPSQHQLALLFMQHDDMVTKLVALRGDKAGLHSLGFDSSLMDLVAEVEQMVACKQANASLRSTQASPVLHRPVSAHSLAGLSQSAHERYQVCASWKVTCTTWHHKP